MPRKGIGAKMAGGNPANGRKEKDWYATPPLVTEALFSVWKPRSPRVWEPACGDGAMAGVIERHGYEVAASDLVDRGYGLTGLDFLSTKRREADCLITNPPFHKDLPARFIRHAFDLGVTEMALLLSQNYWHAVRRVSLFEAHRPSVVMPLTWRVDFEGLGRPTMNLIWCIWSGELGTDARYRLLLKPKSITAQRDLLCSSDGEYRDGLSTSRESPSAS